MLRARGHIQCAATATRGVPATRSCGFRRRGPPSTTRVVVHPAGADGKCDQVWEATFKVLASPRSSVQTPYWGWRAKALAFAPSEGPVRRKGASNGSGAVIDV